MALKVIVLLLLQTCFCFRAVALQAVPVTSPVGKRVDLPCISSLNETVLWGHEPVPGALTELSSGGRIFDGRFELAGTNLVIIKPTIRDAGQYVCIENDGVGPRHVVQLYLTAQKSIKSIVGQTVELPCRPDLQNPSVWWMFIDPNTRESKEVSTWGEIRNGFADSGRFSLRQADLRITNVALNDAGMYACVENDGNGYWNTVQLYVTDEIDTRHQQFRVGEDIVITCNSSSNTTDYWGYRKQDIGAIADIVKFGDVVNGLSERMSLDGHNLIVSNARQGEAGIYSCVENNGLGVWRDIIISQPAVFITVKISPLIDDWLNMATDASATNTVGESKYPYIIIIVILSALLVVALALIIYKYMKHGRGSVIAKPRSHRDVEQPETWNLLDNTGQIAPQEEGEISSTHIKPASPHEILEMIVEKAAYLLYSVSPVHIQQRADTLAVETLSSVCHEWQCALTARPFIRRRMKAWFRKKARIPAEMLKAFCILREELRGIPNQQHAADIQTLTSLATVSRHWRRQAEFAVKKSKQQLKLTFHYRPQLLDNIKTGAHVWGVAQAADKIFVVHEYSNAIKVYENTPPFSQLDDIVIEDIEHPSLMDITSCPETNRLFISDNGGIWRVELALPTDSPNRITRIVKCTEYVPYTLSVTAKRLLVTTDAGDSLYMYPVGGNGKFIQHIELLKEMNVYHAVESTPGSFIVSHIGKKGDRGKFNQVSEVDSRGHVRRVFGNDAGGSNDQLDWPRHVATDSRGRVLVVDSCNCRVVLLTHELKFDRVLLDKKHDMVDRHPHRMVYVEKTSMLVLGADNDLSIYSWK